MIRFAVRNYIKIFNLCNVLDDSANMYKRDLKYCFDIDTFTLFDELRSRNVAVVELPDNIRRLVNEIDVEPPEVRCISLY